MNQNAGSDVSYTELSKECDLNYKSVHDAEYKVNVSTSTPGAVIVFLH